MVNTLALLMAFLPVASRPYSDEAKKYTNYYDCELKTQYVDTICDDTQSVVYNFEYTFYMDFHYLYNTYTDENAVSNINLQVFCNVYELNYYLNNKDLITYFHVDYEDNLQRNADYLFTLSNYIQFYCRCEDNIIDANLKIFDDIVDTYQYTTLPLVFGEFRSTYTLSFDRNSITSFFNKLSNSGTAYDDGYLDGYTDGEQIGYTNGVNETLQNGSVASEIFSGIVNIGLLPINVFLGMLNLEVFGINIGALVTALMTIAITIIVIRLVTGKKND